MKTKKAGTVYKVLSNAALVGLFLTVGILIVGVFQGSLNAGLVLTLSILAIIFACCALSLVWVRNIERKRYFKTSIFFLVLTGASCILWIVSAIVIYLMYKAGDAASSGQLLFIKIALVITLQFVFANIIARNIIRYKKTYIAFQIIHYLSCAFLDFYFSILAFALKFSETGSLALHAGTTDFLFGGIMLTGLIVTCVYIVIANTILNSIEKKRGNGKSRGFIGSLFDDPEFEEDLKPQETVKAEPVQTAVPKTPSPAVEVAKTSIKERLSELQKLYDEQIITEEEYKKTRAEILGEI